ncbi:MAG TPA: glutamine--fructose-6-phosphate transaminase (isomerizing) [Nitrospirae bacterium]|nr:glutamine--fructose-6-phosphate transaminase (isomerizing) [Nitrospirota bacterium]
MCGIIGYIGRDDALDVVVEGLRHLEYRGYDSAGVAFPTDGGIEVRRCKGKIKDLEAIVYADKPETNVAIGHTRWATHGVPSEYNAHPHSSNDIVLVHNGIIENYLDLKRELIDYGYSFTSETDTEVLCHLIDRHSREEVKFEEAVIRALRAVKGAYAIVALSVREPQKMIGVRKDSPLVLGIGEGEFFLASDVPAFHTRTRRVVFLEDDDIVVLSPDGYRIMDLGGNEVERKTELIPPMAAGADKGGYRHYMLKEIHEQPRALSDTLRGRIFPERGEVNMSEFSLDEDVLRGIGRIFIGACGTSWHAALAGKYMIEQIAGAPVEVDLASEFRYRGPLIGEGDLFIAITQSGETADTLAAQREAKRRGAMTLSICNALGATSAREADAVFYTHSGPEIGVASTKAFTAQLFSLYLFALMVARVRGKLGAQDAAAMIAELMRVPEKIERIISNEDAVVAVAKELFKARDFLYLGRGILHPIALEGALKLKEISYIHAEGYPAGEMKHGPIALIDEDVPVVFLVQAGLLKEKVLSNISEVKARGGKAVVVAGEGLLGEVGQADYTIGIPETNPYLEAVLMAVPLQLLAYHIGVLRGCDVDQPRNLAKSVTVE